MTLKSYDEMTTTEQFAFRMGYDQARRDLADPVVQSSWRIVDNALRRMVAHLTASEVGAWSLLRHFHEQAIPQLAQPKEQRNG